MANNPQTSTSTAPPPVVPVPTTATGLGFIVCAVEGVMDVLREYLPARRFPHVSDRERGVECVPWVRGGTFPDGRTQGPTQNQPAQLSQANYFIGKKYLDAAGNAPWRLVWVLPERGQEQFVPPDSIADRIDSVEQGVTFRRIASRVVPMIVEIWGSDYPDTEVLLHWVTSAVYAARVNALVGEPWVTGGGWVEPEKGERGVRYELGVQFAFPVVAPPEHIVVRPTAGQQGSLVLGQEWET